MLILKTVKDFDSALDKSRQKGLTIGFVPTMGALHEGHISLINKSLIQADITVCSVFVNPKQFNDLKDLINYPRTPQQDHHVLESAGCQILFEPDVHEIYPSDFTAPSFHFGSLESVMEGAFRPGHFKGMATVVYRLLKIVKPQKSYFGEKDFQQLAIVRSLVKQAGLETQIIGCETIREFDGLAMSSRNVRLSVAERQNASAIFQTLSQARKILSDLGLEEAKRRMIRTIEASGHFSVEYLEFVEEDGLTGIKSNDIPGNCRVFVAVKASTTRLIDNMKV